MTQPPPPQQPPAEPPSGNPGGETPAPPPQGPPAADPLAERPAGQAPDAPASQGFGAPQEPPAGGFGAPVPPSAGAPQDAGAYGYPQTPPPAQPFGAPGAAPTHPYGHPQQGAPGRPSYGYPPQGAPGQPPYGHPTRPTAPQPGPGGRRGISASMKIVIAACVAIVLIVGGGIVYASVSGGEGREEAGGSAGGSSGGQGGEGDSGKAPDGSGQEKPGARTASKVAYQLPEPAREDLMAVPGSWVTDKAFVKPGANSLVGYDVAKGSVLWTTPLPGQVCGASRHTTDEGLTAILFEARKRTAPKFFERCTEVAVVDLGTGALKWSTSVSGGTTGDDKTQFEQVTLSGGTVAAGGLYGGAAFDLGTGKVKWKPTVDAQNCRDIGYGGGEALVAVRTCGEYGSRTATVQPVDPDSGAPLSSFAMPGGVEDARIVSTDPLVVAADVGDTGSYGISDFFSIDAATGKLRAKIAAPGDNYLARCPASDGVEGCQFVLVGNGKLYLPTAEHEGSADSTGRTNEIIAFDLATGKGAPERADAGEGYYALPLRMDGGNLIVYKRPPYDKGGQVVSIDGATFTQTLLLENPSDRSVREVETRFTEGGSEYRYHAGRFFLSQDLLSEPREKDSQFGKEYLAVVFSAVD
ncbi:PQQ-binding-like beta-propeller repeat protein [Streptomyces sp. C10-9-1]|uniref:outer membrane protein assembly factor BamB family protein n=1 Tax=Streptomyces sp. C10-9-1 TaxID=1859285 RepID=UPI003D70F13D